MDGDTQAHLPTRPKDRMLLGGGVLKFSTRVHRTATTIPPRLPAAQPGGMERTRSPAACLPVILAMPRTCCIIGDKLPLDILHIPAVAWRQRGHERKTHSCEGRRIG